ncbi:MAG: SDR family oxidoreductase [Aeromicrobium erythreum]
MNPSRTALVTGASSGIGAAFADVLAADGLDLVLVARRKDRLDALARELVERHGVRVEVVAADLSDPAAPRAIVDTVHERGLQVDVLVNNAGLSGSSAFAETEWSALATEIQVMVTAVTELAHLVVPGMKQRGWGRIVNVSSLAAFAPPGESLLYTGIKGYVLDMSQALDMELKPHGVHVTALCPGFTRSEFHQTMGTSGAASRLPGILWQESDAVAREGWAAVESGKPVCVPGAVNKVLSHAMRPRPLPRAVPDGSDVQPVQALTGPCERPDAPSGGAPREVPVRSRAARRERSRHAAPESGELTPWRAPGSDGAAATVVHTTPATSTAARTAEAP